MKEILLSSTPPPTWIVTQPDYYLYIDFENQPLGSQYLIDQSGNFEITRIVIDSSKGEDSVIEHEELGKCYNFTGASYFKANKAPDLLGKDFLLEIDLIDKSILVQKTIFTTGDYPSTGPQYPGFNVFLNQYTGNQSIRLFNMFTNNSYTRAYWPLTNIGQRLQLEFLQSDQSILTEKITGVSNTLTRIPYVGFSYLCIGGRHLPDTFFGDFYLKSIKLKIL